LAFFVAAIGIHTTCPSAVGFLAPTKRPWEGTGIETDRRTLDALQRVLEAFNRHDLDAIMSHFADDCVLETPRGPDPWGRRFVGKDEVRQGLAARFEGIPDVHYGDDDHFACGNRGVSEWTISGTTVEGERIEVRGCDLWTFGPDGSVTRKDSFWKIREPVRPRSGG
jgi:ketosteroid isomerase-like protein